MSSTDFRSAFSLMSFEIVRSWRILSKALENSITDWTVFLSSRWLQISEKYFTRASVVPRWGVRGIHPSWMCHSKAGSRYIERFKSCFSRKYKIWRAPSLADILVSVFYAQSLLHNLSVCHVFLSYQIL